MRDRGVVLLLLAVASCPDPAPDPVFEDPELPGLEEVVACKLSHEHELHHVQVFADPAAAELFRACVLGQADCDEPFAPGALFVKREYDQQGCQAADLVGYTAALKQEAGSYEKGHDWHWQRLDVDLRVLDDGAPARCLDCHLDHCAPPDGHDLRCLPD